MARKRKRQPGPPRKAPRTGAINKPSNNIVARDQAEKPLRYRDLTPRQRHTRERALHAVARARRKGISLKLAAREEHVSMRSITRYLPAALKRSKSGALIATRGDRYRRDMMLPTALGDVPIAVYSFREASLLTKFRLALAEYARGLDTSLLRPFEGLTVSGHALLTDVNLLRALLGAGGFRPENIYGAIGGAA